MMFFICFPSSALSYTILTPGPYVTGPNSGSGDFNGYTYPNSGEFLATIEGNSDPETIADIINDLLDIDFTPSYYAKYNTDNDTLE